MHTVDWSPFLSTAVGAAVALLGTLLADTLRSRGDRDRDKRSDRRQAYVDFVIALNGAHARLREIGDPRHGVQDADLETSRAFGDNRVYEGREKMLMSADRSVVNPAERAFQALVGIRDAVRDGAKIRTVGYHVHYHVYSKAMWELRQAIRVDLGAGRIVPADLEKPTWDSRDTCEFCNAA
jgi:hypothetical protein